MRKHVHIGSLVADMYKDLPCIIANVTIDVAHFRKGQRIYLATPHEMDDKVCQIRYRENRTGKINIGEMPWGLMKEVRIAIVPGHIAARCWRDTEEAMTAVVAEIIRRFCPKLEDFSPEFDV